MHNIMLSKKNNSFTSIGVEVDGNKVIVVELTNGVISNASSATMDSLSESWDLATKKYKKYMKNNLFTVSVSNKCSYVNNIVLTTDNLDFENAVFSTYKDTLPDFDILTVNLLEPSSEAGLEAEPYEVSLLGYKTSALAEVLKITSKTKAQLVPTASLLCKVKENVVYTGLSDSVIIQNTKDVIIDSLKTGGVCENIKILPAINKDNNAVDRFLNVIDGDLTDIDALLVVSDMVTQILEEIKPLTFDTNKGIILTGILGSNAEIRETFKQEGVILEEGIYNNSIWEPIPYNDRSEFLVAALAAGVNSPIPDYGLIQELKPVQVKTSVNFPKTSAKIHVAGAALVALGLVLGFYPLFNADSKVQTLISENLNLQESLSNSEEFYKYYLDEKSYLEVIESYPTQILNNDLLQEITQTVPSGVDLKSLKVTVDKDSTTVLMEASGLNSEELLKNWVNSLENTSYVTKVWVVNYVNDTISASYSVAVSINSDIEEGATNE